MPHTDPASGSPGPDPAEAVTLPPGDSPAAEADPRRTTSLPPAPPPPGWSLDGPLPRDFGRYRLLRRLGEGGMGAVFLAHDTQLRRDVALKVPSATGPSDAAARSRFLREARAAAALSHPNICPLHDVGEVDGVPYLTMTFVRGEPLACRIDRAHSLAPDEAIELVRKVAGALHYAHQQGVVHRDLKPGNILIDERGEPVVVDFGLARLGAATQLTQQGELLGTPAYMPPEQITGDIGAIGPASDVYSLGVVLYQLLTGTLPFRGDLLALVSQITLDPPEPPSARRPGLDPRLDAICLKALAKRPADRWASMRDFADALEAAFGTAPAAVLTLRIEGTPFAYRPAPGQEVITVGRQKRKRGDPDDVGNDLVLRVPGNDRLSARISRRHLEIRRAGDGLVVIDRSKAGTLRNGQPLPPDTPTPLRPGDRLSVAGVICLEVAFEEGPVAGAGRTRAAPAAVVGPVLLEATLGDVVTLD